MTFYRRTEELDFRLEDLPRVAPPKRMLMADPAAFDVEYEINPHMTDAAGALKRVDKRRAREQWSDLKGAFERLGVAVDVVAPLEGQPDLVFCANPTLPIPPEASADRRPRVVPSNMRWPQRRGEVKHVVEALEARGHVIERLVTSERVEGMGDGLWHPGRLLLWAGIGPRSSAEAWREVAVHFGLRVLAMELVEPDFYHLDTALALLREDTCLWLPDALSPASRALVERFFPRRIEADDGEAHTLLACNATCPDGRHVVIQRGCRRTCERLAAAGFEVVELETGEFLKSGGSVFCMKLAHWGGAA